MRVFTVMCLVSIMPLSAVYAADSDYHYVHYGDAAQQGSSNMMEYYDGGGYARNMLPGLNLMDSGSDSGAVIPPSRQDYSAPQDHSISPTSSPASPSDSLLLNSPPSNPSFQDNSQQGVQP